MEMKLFTTPLDPRSDLRINGLKTSFFRDEAENRNTTPLDPRSDLRINGLKTSFFRDEAENRNR
jgi:hypothetical protein